MNPCLAAAALALTALAHAQVKNNEAETSGVLRTARIIQVLPEMNQLNESARDQSDASKVGRFRETLSWNQHPGVMGAVSK